MRVLFLVLCFIALGLVIGFVSTSIYYGMKQAARESVEKEMMLEDEWDYEE